MRCSIFFAGLAALTLAGTAALAAGNNLQTHQIIVQLPGGGEAHITYTGDVAPKVVVDSAPGVMPSAGPMAFPGGPPFAEMDRISADIHRQMESLMRQTQAMAAMPDAQGLSTIDLNKLPPGASSYSWTSTSNGSHFCSRMVQVTTPANGGKPQVVTKQSGDCGSAVPSSTAEKRTTL